VFEESDGFAKPHHRVGQSGWVAKEKVEQPSYKQGHYGDDAAIHLLKID
jgi:hypothetical protein